MLHVCITATLTSCFTPILVMLQGRSISPVHRFLTKSGEWVWMQMCITLLYIPNTNKPYAATHLFRVIKYVSAWLLYTYKVSLCMCKPHDVGYCSYIAQNFGNRKLWRFTTNQPTFYLNPANTNFLYSNLPRFSTAKVLCYTVYVHTYVRIYIATYVCIRTMKVSSDNIIAILWFCGFLFSHQSFCIDSYC